MTVHCAVLSQVRRGVETSFSHLGYGKGDRAHTGPDCLRFVPVGMTFPVSVVFVFSGLRVLGSFRLHHAVELHPRISGNATNPLREFSSVVPAEKLSSFW